ncbi:mRNA decay activator protein ZFP36 [Genypterus blacodes]|uniref:mRNA decay activator protein ZFP36 n=1 Tax=Genypterus blacodes TaxID=154954 RepID=UPI003F764733
MSEMLDNILAKNLLTLALDDGFLPTESHLKLPAQSCLNRSASFFSSPPLPSSSQHSLSSEHISDDDIGGTFWSSNIWSKPAGKPQQLPFRPDRSMSLTEFSSSMLSCAGAASVVAPPPGFPPSPAQLPAMLSSNRYKTELCRGFQETGSCKYGTKCQFAHGEEELRGLYRHPKYKTEHCRTFYNFGYCPYGARCHFIHENKLSDSPLQSSKIQRQPLQMSASGPNPRHQLRQSVSFAGFLGSSRSSPPLSFPLSYNDPNLGFSRAPSVSPPPTDLLSPVFGDSMQREAVEKFHFGRQQSRASSGDIHSLPLTLEHKATHCTCGHGNNFSALSGSNSRVFPDMEDGQQQGNNVLLPAFAKPTTLQRFSSEDSLEDSYSSSSGGSSGTESPTFDGSTKRLTVFERLSLSD